MPDLTELSLSEAINRLKKLGLRYEIAGDTDDIIGTLPAASTPVPIGDIVLIRTRETES